MKMAATIQMSSCPLHRVPSDSTLFCPFRLFKVEGVGRDDVLEISLHEGSHSHDVEYTAISYAWDDEPLSVLIRCNGQQSMVTPSIWLLIGGILIEQKQSYYWLDQVCVDQVDVSDKERQVPLMDIYFSQASMVLVWLGCSTDLTDAAFDLMPDIYRKMAEPERVQEARSHGALSSLGIPQPSSDFWYGLGDILCRRWFLRLWTLQEIALAREAMFQCGSRGMKVYSFLDFLDRLRLADLESLIEYKTSLAVHERWNISWLKAALDITKANRNGLPLIVLMVWARARQTSEAVDRVYAVLSLAEPHYRNAISINYTPSYLEQYWRLYVDVSHQMLNEQMTLDLLLQPPSPDRPRGLPSWCPNFNSNSGTTMIDPQHFTSGGHFNADTDLPPHYATSFDRHSIVLHGLRVDIVKEIVPLQLEASEVRKGTLASEGAGGHPILNLASIQKWLSNCYSLAERTIPTPDGVRSSFLRTITGNVLGNPIEFNPHLCTLQHCYEVHQKFAEAQMTIPPEYRGWRPTADDNLALSRIASAIRGTCNGRNVFSTNTNLLGSGPVYVTPGDLICVFRGVRLPLILRKLDIQSSSLRMTFDLSKNHDRCQLVGEAYVHGIMHGEAYTLREDSGIGEQFFTLI